MVEKDNPPVHKIPRAWILFLWFLILFVSACGQFVTPLQTATPYPTYTPYPTLTVHPTVTPVPVYPPRLSPSLQEGLEAYWSFDGSAEDGNWHDLTGHGHDLVPMHKPSLVPGRIGNAVSLLAPDRQYLEQTDSSLHVDHDFTWAGWIYPVSNTDHYILSKYQFGKGALLSIREGLIRFWVYGSNSEDRLESNTVDMHAWHFVCAGYSSGDHWIYLQVDGEMASQTLSITIDDPGGSFAVGRNSSTLEDGFWSGALDELGLWDRMLTPDECLELYDYDMAQTLPSTKEWGWQQQTPYSTPSPRKGIGMVYDQGRDLVVAVGGTDWTMVSGETWEYDGIAWHLREDVNRIPERSGASMAYDIDRQITVLFGGNGLGNNEFFDDTWEYDGNEWVLQHSSQSPPPRNGAVMAYDTKRQRMLLFGGYGRYGNSPFFDDTWEYVDGEWRQLDPPRHPPAREAARMVYDQALGRIVLFGGGQDAGSVVFGDTWEWDGEDWVERTDLSNSPPARWAFFMTYDEECQRVVLFGGLTGTIDQFNDTWTYDGTAWKQESSDREPPARWDGGLVYDSSHQRLVLFGGQYWNNSFGFLNDTWYFTDSCE